MTDLAELREAIRLICFGHPVNKPYAKQLKALIRRYERKHVIPRTIDAEYLCLSLSTTSEILRIAKELRL